VDCPNTRDLQFLVTDGQTFFAHENGGTWDTAPELSRGKSTLYYRLVARSPDATESSKKSSRTRTSVVLMAARLEILDERLRGDFPGVCPAGAAPVEGLG